MLRALKCDDLPEAPRSDWLTAFAADTRRRLVSLYAHEFKSFGVSTALTLVDAGQLKTSAAAAAADAAAAINGTANGSSVEGG